MTKTHKFPSLGEELDGEGGVDPALAEEAHGGGKDGDDPRRTALHILVPE